MKCSVSHGSARNRAFLSARLHVLAAIAGLSLPLLAGCPGSLEGNWPPAQGNPAGSGGMTGTGTGGMMGGGTGGASGACDAPAMWLQSTNMTAGGCSPAGCHSAGGFNPNFTGDAWAALSGKNAMLGSCASQPFVSGKGEGVLFKRLKGTECGASMPFVQPINQGAIECITSWVNSKL